MRTSLFLLSFFFAYLAIAQEPTVAPTVAPTVVPTVVPTVAPTDAATSLPTDAATSIPTTAPTSFPTDAPTSLPTEITNPENVSNAQGWSVLRTELNFQLNWSPRLVEIQQPLDGQPSSGDFVYFDSQLINETSGLPIQAFDRGFCVFINEKADMFCSLTLTFSGDFGTGSLAMQGVFNSSEGSESVVAITGGTGEFIAATGELRFLAGPTGQPSRIGITVWLPKDLNPDELPTLPPTEVPTTAPTTAPTGEPTVVVPTGEPTVVVPTGEPTVVVPTGEPTVVVPTGEPTVVVPTGEPTVVVPTGEPTVQPPTFQTPPTIAP